MLAILNKTGRRGATCLCSVCKQPFETLDRFTAKKVHAGDQCDICKNLPSNPPTQELLHQVYNYDPDTGLLTYKRDFSRRKKGENPTSQANNDYLVLTMDKTYLVHRIVWMMQTGAFTEFVDHKNHIRNDNRWDNLQTISKQGNAQNKSVNTNNTSGYLGVSYMKTLKKFRASITINREHIHLGVFNTAELANAARIAASNSAGFHPNHGT
jgi:HNH endonuclease